MKLEKKKGSLGWLYSGTRRVERVQYSTLAIGWVAVVTGRWLEGMNGCTLALFIVRHVWASDRTCPVKNWLLSICPVQLV
jgi:hypothetical protein